MKECPGENKCHGCMSWCELCGDVSYVCDDTRCDTHQRENEVIQEIIELEKEIRRNAEKCRNYEIVIRENRYHPADYDRPPNLRPLGYEYKQMLSSAEMISCNENHIIELENRIKSIKYWQKHGCVMVPRIK
ncbi:MAG TPA: hypothetical protein VIE65_02880 [Methylobacter sp.]|jgi:hypothetical protein